MAVQTAACPILRHLFSLGISGSGGRRRLERSWCLRRASRPDGYVLFGGSGEVGGAVAREPSKSDVCAHLTLMGRRVGTLQGTPKVEQVVVDTSAADFEEVVQEKAIMRSPFAALESVGRHRGGAGSQWRVAAVVELSYSRESRAVSR